jgi:glycosyltransferase involved in cell wall biosynthesis
MNILMLVTRRQNRGAEVSAANLTKQLIEMGHFVMWVGLYSTNLNEVLEISKATTVDLTGQKKKILNFTKIKELRFLIKEYNIDIIQANGSDTLKYAVAASLFTNKPKIVYRNISHVSYWIKNNIIKRGIYRFLFKKIHAIASVSHAAAIEFAAVMKVNIDKIKVIKRGIPIKIHDKGKSRDEINLEFNLINTNKLIVWAGALSKEKNPLFALEVMKQLNTIRKDCTLIMAGAGPEETKVKELINHLQLDNVLLVGFCNDIHGLLAAADVLILTSFIEGVPGIVLEAAAQKTPTIAVDCGSTSEALLHNKTGFLIKKYDPIEFTESIDSLFKSEQLSLEFGDEALAHVNREHNGNRNANKFEALYQTLLSR